MNIYNDFPLKAYNTFGIDAYAKWFASFSSPNELKELLSEKNFTNSKILILGGGSNILFTKNQEGVLKNEIKGIEKTGEDTEHIYIKAGAGESWHQFVLFCLKNNWAGIENLSLIPGNAGAAPMQNIGAYGVEIKDVFYSLDAFHLKDKETVTLNHKDCDFGYRESVFKNKYKGQFAILSVTLRLNKIPHYHTSYGAIEKELEVMNVKDLSIQAISQAVINIRTAKLPDPKEIGNAGSFFKNPEVSPEKYEQLKKDFPELIAYPVNDQFKLAAGWMIEQSGWKGYKEGEVGVHAKQALVLVNYGHASGKDIYKLSEKIQQSIFDKFGVTLEREVNVT
ncbi:MAG: UDP-N-acetylmuramate dehydrogenase [Chitinophagaceae bacterium]